MHFDASQPAHVRFRSIAKEGTRRVVAWLGSGLSVNAGMPTWSQLKDRLSHDLHAKARTLEQKELNRLVALRDAAAYESNPWKAFNLLRHALGPTSFSAAIRQNLDIQADTELLDPYRQIWRLPLAGVLNLNLDRLATQAYIMQQRPRPPLEFHGTVAGRYAHVLQRPQPFIVNLHGTVDDDGSWVLVDDDLRDLLSNPGYASFIRAVLLTHTVIFVGVSADDVAAGGHLDALRRLDIDCGDHFWVTDRSDAATDAWAESAGVQVIRYAKSDGHEGLREFFDDVLAFLPRDEAPDPVIPDSVAGAVGELPSLDSLEQLSYEALREVLNAHAAHILRSNDPNRYDRYAEFCDEYDPAIHRAWYISTRSGRNKLFEYTLEDKIGGGAFGNVYSGTSAGRVVAIKVLHQDVRGSKEMLQGFRRGVRSMQILADRKIAGVVPYLDAGEIPAFAVMEYVNGPTIAEAVGQRMMSRWKTILNVGHQLASVIRTAHHLPERVMHRDIRPANIIIKNGWQPEEEWEVVVTDFDLSWHRDSIEKSVGVHATMNGFLAPEQFRRVPGISTRSAAVDAYGLGMTLYFMRTSDEPVVGLPEHISWKDILKSGAAAHPCPEWRSLSRRFFRLVYQSTMFNQPERLPVTQIEGMLKEMQQCVCEPLSVESAALLAEELAARAIPGEYSWNEDEATASYRIGALGVKVSGDEIRREVRVECEWTQTGDENYESVRKWIPRAVDQSVAALTSARFKCTSSDRNYSFQVGARIPKSRLRSHMTEAAEAVAEAIDKAVFRG